MNQVDQIKEPQRQGLGSQEIAGRLKLNRKSVAKYMKVEDFNGALMGKKASASKLDAWKPKIDKWLAEDRRMRCCSAFILSILHLTRPSIALLLQDKYLNPFGLFLSQYS
jgi:hypothetical protein